MLLPVDLRQWVPENDLVHFVISAVDSMNLSAVSVNTRGSGSKQYPPRMMLALLIYCYCNGVFASRRIEGGTYRDVAVRYLTGDTHPDHDTICEFRRENGKVVKEAVVEVLRLGRQMGLVKVGMVSVDGTHIKANASKHKSVRYDRAGELEELLRKDVEELLQRAAKADAEAVEDGQKLPQERGGSGQYPLPRGAGTHHQDLRRGALGRPDRFIHLHGEGRLAAGQHLPAC
jgi:transposase